MSERQIPVQELPLREQAKSTHYRGSVKYKRVASSVVLLLLVAGVTSLLFAQDSTTLAQDSTATPSPIKLGIIATDLYGFEMVYVPAGSFQRGVDQEKYNKFCDSLNLTQEECKERKEINESSGLFNYLGAFAYQDITVQGYWIDRYEITITQFNEFTVAMQDNYNYLSDYEDIWPQLFDNDQKPQIGINWYDAMTFCNNRQARLPTEVEWEYAASGPENNNFPWGNNIDETNMSQYFTIQTTYPVGSKPDNVSWIGGYDMAGNVAEWVEDRFASYPETGFPEEWTTYARLDTFRVVRGGAWGLPIDNATTFARDMHTPDEIPQNVGFRCARTSDPRQNK